MEVFRDTFSPAEQNEVSNLEHFFLVHAVYLFTYKTGEELSWIWCCMIGEKIAILNKNANEVKGLFEGENKDFLK